jgi:hypothetical protein
VVLPKGFAAPPPPKILLEPKGEGFAAEAPLAAPNPAKGDCVAGVDDVVAAGVVLSLGANAFDVPNGDGAGVVEDDVPAGVVNGPLGANGFEVPNAEVDEDDCPKLNLGVVVAPPVAAGVPVFALSFDAAGGLKLNAEGAAGLDSAVPNAPLNDDVDVAGAGVVEGVVLAGLLDTPKLNFGVLVVGAGVGAGWGVVF